jgi:PadR family transcriptional regulator PadR
MLYRLLSRQFSSYLTKEFGVAKGSLTYATTVILQAVDNGYRYGFDIIDITGMPGGTVYPALRRLEEAGHLSSKWEEPRVSQAAPRPARKYYELTRSGRGVLVEAVKRYRLLEQTQPPKSRTAKPSRA